MRHLCYAHAMAVQHGNDIVADMIGDDGLTIHQRAFISAMPDHITITATCAALQLSRPSVYNWRDDSAAFRDALLQAKETVADNLERELYRRAMVGAGQMPDTLGIFLLKGLRPMYRESYTVKHEGTIGVLSVDLTAMDPVDRLALLDLARSAEVKLLPAPVDTTD